MPDLRQEDFKIHIVGTVVAPPTADEVTARVCEAADRKQPLLLSPAECRVLVGLLEL